MTLQKMQPNQNMLSKAAHVRITHFGTAKSIDDEIVNKVVMYWQGGDGK